jgi:hypothetical protein
MAETPRGFLSAQHRTGGVAKTTEYDLASGQTVYVGDLVQLASGEITLVTTVNDGATATVGDIIHGVVAAYSKYGEPPHNVSLTSNTNDAVNKVLVYDDLDNTIFEVVATHATAVPTEAVMRNQVWIPAVTAANATLKQSRHEINSDAAQEPPTTIPVTRKGILVLEESDRPDARTATSVTVRCKIYTSSDIASQA